MVIFLEKVVAKVENQNEWAVKAKNILKAELKRKGVGYRELAEKLSEMGTEIGEQGVANKISRGGFSASFMVQCFEAIGEREIRI